MIGDTIQQIRVVYRQVRITQRQMRQLCADSSRRHTYAARLRDEQQHLLRCRVALECDLPAVDDPLVRDILRLRYCRAHTWVAVACRVGGGNTAEGVRSIARRYLSHTANDAPRT